MFRIGEFAQIAQVSGRQLRFYEQLGLLLPAHTDANTGYRHYSIRQLPRLNKILALKEFGLSLEQIGPILDAGITREELRGMLTMKRAQVELALREETARLRHIESRIALIDRSGFEGFDVVLKSVAPTPFLAQRYACKDMNEALDAVRSVARAGAAHIRSGLRDRLMVIARNEAIDDVLELDIGYALNRAPDAARQVCGDIVLQRTDLAAVDKMATVVRQGTDEDSHRAFGAIGSWIEANNYIIVGPCREVFLESVCSPAGVEGALVEIQFPVQSGL